MDNEEATTVLQSCLREYRRLSHAELAALMGKPRVTELRGASGIAYQVEVEVHWDHLPGGPIRVLGSIDDGGWRALKPLNDDFIMEG